MKHKFSSMGRVAIALVLALSLSLVMAVPVAADASVSQGFGAVTISADTALTAPGAAPTDLNAANAQDLTLGFDEADFALTETLQLNAPVGLDFIAPVPDINIAFGGTAADLAFDAGTLVAGNIVWTVTTAATGTGSITLTIGGTTPTLIQPEANPNTSTAFGEITLTGTAGDPVLDTTPIDTGISAITVEPGAVAAYTVVPAAGPYTAGTAFDVVITAVDQFDNPLGAGYVTDEPYTWVTNADYAPNGTGPDIGTLVAGDFIEGVATKSVTLYAAESDVIFTITDDSAITDTSAAITVDPEALAAYTVVPDGLEQTAGTEFSVVITAVDVYENPLGATYSTAEPYTWTTTASDSPDIGILVFTDFGATGVATKPVTLDFIETGVTFYVEDSNEPAITGTSEGVAVVAGPADYLAVTGDPTMIAGGTNELTVTACDAAGNPATSYIGSKTLVFSGPGVAPDETAPTVEGVTMQNETTVTFTAGVSSATLIAYNAETITVHVTTDGTLDSTGYGLALTVDPAAAAQLAYTVEPETVVAGVETSKFTVQRQDQYANPVTSGATVVGLASDSTGAAVVFKAAPGGDAVTEVTIADAASTADFYYSDEKAGAWTITASATGLTSADSALTVNPATINHYWVSEITSPQVIGAAFEVIIQAQDIFNNDITDVTETETVNITYGKMDDPATPDSIITANGTFVLNVRLTEITLGQFITFAGVTSTKEGTSNPFQVVDVGAIHHYEVTVAVGPQTVDATFDVIIQAKDAAGNDITLGPDKAEAITIDFGLPGAGATWTPPTTSAGTATVSDMEMSVGQAGQTIIVTGAVSGMSGTSSSFTVYDVIMVGLPDVWILISTDIWINSTDSAWIDEPVLQYKAAGSVFSSEVTLADLKPVEALYVKGGTLGLIFSTDVQGVSAKELVAGWNLISCASSGASNAQAVLSGLHDVANAGTGLTTVVSQGIYNVSGDFYVDATEWTNLLAITLDPFDGYWIRMNAAKTFGVVPVLQP